MRQPRRYITFVRALALGVLAGAACEDSEPMDADTGPSTMTDAGPTPTPDTGSIPVTDTGLPITVDGPLPPPNLARA